ncbi:MAG: hypothetical protein VW686_10985, partial [Luminiphilus sp.]
RYPSGSKQLMLVQIRRTVEVIGAYCGFTQLALQIETPGLGAPVDQRKGFVGIVDQTGRQSERRVIENRDQGRALHF